MENKIKILDTNVLLDYPQIIEENENTIILVEVLRELDGLKSNQNFETAFKARRAAAMISNYLSKITFKNCYEDKKMSVDDKLLLCAEDFSGQIITNDIYLRVKARIKGIEVQEYGNNNSTYTGIINLLVSTEDFNSNQDLNKIYNEKIPPFEMRENQYLIIKNKDDNELINIFVYRDEKLQEVKYYEIRNHWIGKIKPRQNNPEQICLFEALNNKETTILYAGGGQGKGKSFILNNYALQELDKGNIKKIVYIPNNAYVEESMEIGLLPGDSFEKTTPLIGPLIDLIGIDEVVHLMQSEQLEIIPIAYLRGRNFDDTIVIVNEAQNITPNHVKLLIGRIGDNSRIFFDGSLQQIDSDIFKNKNGLRSLLQLSNSEYSNMFSVVRLEKVERSKTAQIADYLDEIGGF